MAGQPSKDYNSVDWKSLVYYDETSPTFLRWNVKIPKSSRNIGDVAGYINNSEGASGYSLVKYKKKLYKAHRIVWILFNSTIDNDLYIDHLDGNPSNNAFSNLRLVTETENNRSRKLPKSNKSGFAGVSLCIANGSQNYMANWRDVTGKKVQRWFSCNKYGKELALKLAIKCREEAIKSIGAYSDRHGK